MLSRSAPDGLVASSVFLQSSDVWPVSRCGRRAWACSSATG